MSISPSSFDSSLSSFLEDSLSEKNLIKYEIYEETSKGTTGSQENLLAIPRSDEDLIILIKKIALKVLADAAHPKPDNTDDDADDLSIFDAFDPSQLTGDKQPLLKELLEKFKHEEELEDPSPISNRSPSVNTMLDICFLPSESEEARAAIVALRTWSQEEQKKLVLRLREELSLLNPTDWKSRTVLLILEKTTKDGKVEIEEKFLSQQQLKV